jgi:hypothetical protein
VANKPYYLGAGTHVSNKQARLDTSAVLIAQLLRDTTGDVEPTERTMAALVNDPDRLGAVCLMLSNQVAQLSRVIKPFNPATGRDGLQDIIDHIIADTERNYG